MTSKARILVVEDEALIRMALADALADAGYAVIEAGNVLEAVAALASHENMVAVVTDVDMPGSLTGVDLAKLVASTKPACSIFVTSGRLVEDGNLPPKARFFSKPYNIGHLVEEVARTSTTVRPVRHAANCDAPLAAASLHRL